MLNDVKGKCPFSDFLKSMVQIVKVLRGFPCTIMPRNSRVILHMPEGYHGVLLGNVHENFEMFKHLVKATDCIVSPMCEFEFHCFDHIPERAFIKIEVPPHCKSPKMEGSIKVISRDRYQDCIAYAQKLEPWQKPPDRQNMYFRFNETHIEIFSNHFSQFIVFAENRSMAEVVTDHNCCTRCVEILGFEKWIRSHDGRDLEVTLCVSSLQHENVFIKTEGNTHTHTHTHTHPHTHTRTHTHTHAHTHTHTHTHIHTHTHTPTHPNTNPHKHTISDI